MHHAPHACCGKTANTGVCICAVDCRKTAGRPSDGNDKSSEAQRAAESGCRKAAAASEHFLKV